MLSAGIRSLPEFMANRIFSLTSARLSCGICWGMIAYISLMIVGKTKNTPQGLPYGVAVAGLSWSVLVSQFDFAQSKTVETVPGSYAVLEFDVYTTVLVELNLLGMGSREVVPSGYIDIPVT